MAVSLNLVKSNSKNQGHENHGTAFHIDESSILLFLLIAAQEKEGSISPLYSEEQTSPLCLCLDRIVTMFASSLVPKVQQD